MLAVATVMSIVSEQTVLACRNMEELGQWKYNKAVSHFITGGDSLVRFLVVYILSQGSGHVGFLTASSEM